MRASELFYPTLRENPSEAEIISHQLLLRAGFIRKTSTGVYTYLPLAYKVIKKIIDIVREEMDRAGGQEILMPIIQPKELWEKSGRWGLYGDEMFKLKDRHNRDFALGPTHEEIVTTITDENIHSYRDLPLLLYQIQNKYRDEIRPRYGVMRAREFIMKDLYSFDTDEPGMNISYKKMYQAYRNVFDRLNLKYRVVEADSGAIGGNENHEFIVLADNGESLIVYCDQCEYAANVERAVCRLTEHKKKEEFKPREKIHTPGQKTISDLAINYGIEPENQLKTLTYMMDGELVAVILRGDHELNEIKLNNALNAKELIMADEETVRQHCGVGFGSIGPVDLNLKIYADQEVENMVNFSCGANEDDYHFINVNIGREITPASYLDLRSAAPGDPCPLCEGHLQSVRGIEVGHIFKLGTKYSELMEAGFLDRDGQKKLMVMGCYGIGVTRTMAAAIEQNYDENGIIWPASITPYQVIIIPVNNKNNEQMIIAREIYRELCENKVDALLDDRDERAGVKFKDADLIGIPIRLVIGPKSSKENTIEIKKRWEKEIEHYSIQEAVDVVIRILEETL